MRFFNKGEENGKKVLEIWKIESEMRFFRRKACML